MNMTRKALFIVVGIMVALFLIWMAMFPDYIFINDTGDHIQGSIFGDSSPTIPIDLLPGQTKLTVIPWVSGAPNLLKASPYSREIHPTCNLLFVRIVKISQLQRY
jgi:hypothetical protein